MTEQTKRETVDSREKEDAGGARDEAARAACRIAFRSRRQIEALEPPAGPYCIISITDSPAIGPTWAGCVGPPAFCGWRSPRTASLRATRAASGSSSRNKTGGRYQEAGRPTSSTAWRVASDRPRSPAAWPASGAAAPERWNASSRSATRATTSTIRSAAPTPRFSRPPRRQRYDLDTQYDRATQGVSLPQTMSLSGRRCSVRL